MKRMLLALCTALLSCSLADQAVNSFSPTSDAESADRSSPSPTVDPSGAETVYIAPFCTLLGEERTRTEDYGNVFVLAWGWEAQTEQQVRDYLENAMAKVTFNGESVADAERTDVYEQEGAFHVFWEKSLGILERGKYPLTFFVEFRNVIFDGMEYFGPGTDNESVEDTCYLIVE
ncbi:MAG: hypothetical protein JW748_06765 [Anaerolineales bacterium]|nr:hypothetical protein [Anaerolineales bacterium]